MTRTARTLLGASTAAALLLPGCLSPAADPPAHSPAVQHPVPGESWRIRPCGGIRGHCERLAPGP